MIQLQEYHQLPQSTGPYAYNAVAPGAPIGLVKLARIYQTAPGQVRYYDFDKEIRRVARLNSTNERYLNLFPFEDTTDLSRRLGTSKYVMSPWESPNGSPVRVQKNTKLITVCGLTGTPHRVSLLGLRGKECSGCVQSVDVEDVALHSPLLAESQLVVCVISAA